MPVCQGPWSSTSWRTHHIRGLSPDEIPLRGCCHPDLELQGVSDASPWLCNAGCHEVPVWCKKNDFLPWRWSHSGTCSQRVEIFMPWLKEALHKLAWVAVLWMLGWTGKVLPKLRYSVVHIGQVTQSLWILALGLTHENVKNDAHRKKGASFTDFINSKWCFILSSPTT